jgi:hypothetical protein
LLLLGGSRPRRRGYNWSRLEQLLVAYQSLKVVAHAIEAARQR